MLAKIDSQLSIFWGGQVPTPHSCHRSLPRHARSEDPDPSGEERDQREAERGEEYHGVNQRKGRHPQLLRRIQHDPPERQDGVRKGMQDNEDAQGDPQ